MVPQKRREPLLAVELRRRMRRMELARPAKVVVVERDIMVWILVFAFWRAAGGLVPGPRPLMLFRSGQPEMGAGAVLVIRGCEAGSVCCSRRSTGAVAADR